MASSDSVFSQWQEKLRSLGFESAGTGGRRGIYMTRRAAPLEQAVGAMISDSHDDAFNIQVHLSMPLRGSEPPHNVVVLSGDVSSNGVRIEHQWLHDPEFATWWPQSRVDEGLRAVVEHGIGWLERHSDLVVLTGLFEEGYQKYHDEVQAPQNESFLRKTLRRLGIGDPAPGKARREYLLWLAMIYEERGLLDLATDRLEAYAAARRRDTNVNEQARLNRHRKALENASRSSDAD